MRWSLDLQLPDLYAEDQPLIDAMRARHPTWDRAHLEMKLFGARAMARSLVSYIVNGCDARGGWEPPGDIIGVAGVSLHPEANGPVDCYKVAVDLTHVSGRTRRVEIGTYRTVADAWRLIDEAVDGLRKGP